MRFRTVQWPPDSAPTQRPAVSLGRDNWDDFHFKTLWHARLWLSSGRKVELGAVKVLKRGMRDEGGRVDLPENFEALEDEICSLGQALSYYETLAAADAQEPGIAATYLRAMRDAATDPAVRASFENEPGFETSLLRDRAAAAALDGGAAIIQGELAPSSGSGLEIVYDLPGLDEPLHLSFGDTSQLPSRMHTVIGYNGVGKTRLLASLGWVLAVVEDERDAADFVARNGRLVGHIPDISAVLSVSYSAFDTFAIPGARGGPLLERTYRYCGLRSLDDVENDGAQLTLKSIDAIREDFHSARVAAVTKLREAELADIFGPMLREPSFAMVGELPGLTADRAPWEEALGRFSTGHTIVLTILVHLCAHLEQRSLVLFDEPEMHLHPPLVASLLSSVQVALKTFDSFAIAATHSPVVAQEVPSSHVLMLRRASNASAVIAPEVETFGENVGLLTSRIFHLDNSRSDFRRVLQELAADRTVDEIDDLFLHGLSSQARVIVLSEQAAREEL